jgi:DNA modification methylase
METTHRIIIGDSRSMQELSDHSVHLVITSPPYWQLKDYGTERQIGFDHTYQEYINNLNLVWTECHRLLHPGCRLCINIGDQFARSVYYGRYKVIPIRTEIIKFCESAGFDYMGAIIWQKVTTCHTTGGATVMGSFPYPRSGILKLDYEFILVFRKPGQPPRVTKKTKDKSKLTTKEWNQYFAGHWNFPGERQDRHLAMFPVELPRRLIKMFSFVGDTVLDPFLGSGTTSLAARQLSRHSVGYEINKEFLPVIRRKLGMKGNRPSQDATIEIVESTSRDIDFEEKVQALPYIFTDMVGFDKKVDPRSMEFGSKITAGSGVREKYYRVKEIPSPEIMVLDDGTKVRLLGVKPLSGKQAKAIGFLREKTRRAKIFLRQDPRTPAHDRQGNLLCYVYLSNRTFLNAHLIKNGMADVDTSRNYRAKARFLQLRKIPS